MPQGGSIPTIAIGVVIAALTVFHTIILRVVNDIVPIPYMVLTHLKVVKVV